MEAIQLIEGVKITDMYLGISATREDGETGRYELTALPKGELSALGTKMYVVVDFDEGFNVPAGVVIRFQYDNYPEIQEFGLDKLPESVKTFDILPPYKSQKIKKIGEHVINVTVVKKNFDADGELIMSDSSGVKIPYRVVA